MIRIDEIYYNVFVAGLRHRPDIICHWFDPFGSTDFQDMCVRPATLWPEPITHRLIFWDQEPVRKITGKKFMQQFEQRYHHETAKRTIVTSEKNSKDLQWLCDTYSVDQQHYFFHGWAALDWYRGYNHSFLSTPWHQRKLTNPLMIPNNIIGGQRHHRIRLLAELDQRKSIDMNLVSFPAVCPHENVSAVELAASLGYDISHIKLPLVIDSIRNHHRHSSKIDLWEHAEKTFCQVVTETVYEDRLHLTEKIFKPIVQQQPFILLGSKHGLEYLRSYGFKTFHDVWNEEYDDLDDDRRVHAVADLCSEISHWDKTKLAEMQQHCQSIVEHNHQWFYGGFQDVLWKELNEMIDTWI